MPELPEVETVRRELAAALLGRRVLRARLLRPDICVTEDGRAPGPENLLESRVIAALDRRGKQLAIIADSGRVVVVHLGMSGQLLVLRPDEQPRRAGHIHATWDFEDGRRLLFRDPRRFGGLWPLPSCESLAERWQALGPDALNATGEHLHRIAHRSARPIKAVLLDQAVLAGVGNIYADEALFQAGISPRRKASRLTGDEWSRLALAIRQTLRRAVAARGSTLRDYVGPNGRAGRAQVKHRVYGRAGQDCVKCRGRLRGIRLAQRATVYCPRCQR